MLFSFDVISKTVKRYDHMGKIDSEMDGYNLDDTKPVNPKVMRALER